MTRNSFKRKAIIFGVMIFMSIALISTGFAAWIISTNAKNQQNGNIEVGVVTEKNIKIEDVKFKDGKKSFIFEPKETDNTGRVRNDGSNFESLSVTIEGKITNVEYLNTLMITLNLPTTLSTAASATKNYIVLPECAKSAQEVTVDRQTGLFSYTITFKWGSAFKDQNPGEYYDNNDPNKGGVNVSDEDMIATLNDLRTTIYGENIVDPQFTIVLDATAN
ncbi:MAG: hypothetical protein PUH11_08325 [Bacilli bacterium]|nr:hypothetical protein [Bacilli bacterium]